MSNNPHRWHHGSLSPGDVTRLQCSLSLSTSKTMKRIFYITIAPSAPSKWAFSTDAKRLFRVSVARRSCDGIGPAWSVLRVHLVARRLRCRSPGRFWSFRGRVPGSARDPPARRRWRAWDAAEDCSVPCCPSSCGPSSACHGCSLVTENLITSH